MIVCRVGCSGQDKQIIWRLNWAGGEGTETPAEGGAGALGSLYRYRRRGCIKKRRRLREWGDINTARKVSSLARR